MLQRAIGIAIVLMALLQGTAGAGSSWDKCEDECLARVDLVRKCEHVWWVHAFTDPALDQIRAVIREELEGLEVACGGGGEGCPQDVTCTNIADVLNEIEISCGDNGDTTCPSEVTCANLDECVAETTTGNGNTDIRATGEAACAAILDADGVPANKRAFRYKDKVQGFRMSCRRKGLPDATCIVPANLGQQAP